MTVKTFDSIEDLFEEQDENRLTADSHVKVAQRKIKTGDCFMRFYPSANIMIYGEAIDPLEFFEGKDLDADEGELRAEMEWEKASRAAPHMKNYRFCRAYSVVCPDGELGDTHVSVMMPISREVFDFAKANGWPSVPMAAASRKSETEHGSVSVSLKTYAWDGAKVSSLEENLNSLILDARNGTGFWEDLGGRA